MGSRGSNRTGQGVAAIAAALALSGPGLAAAQDNGNSPGAGMPGLYQASMGARRYETPDGAVRFTLDRSGSRVALVLFEGDPEVHVLRPAMAAGGAEIYRTEDGAVTLRIMPHGGVIVYTASISTGAPAAEGENVAPLTPQTIALAEMRARFNTLQRRAERASGHPVEFLVPANLPPQMAGLFLDAAERAAEGMAAAPVSNVRQVFIRPARQPGVTLDGARLIIDVAPHLGYEGRPSSTAVRNAIGAVVQGPER
jgi:hypothetical protein